MFAVIFEVEPKAGKFHAYLGLAKLLKPRLAAIDGFLDNERFASARKKGRLLSLSIWRDEKAAIRWRTLGAHHQAQQKGRAEVLADYHLRVGEVTADSSPPRRARVIGMRFDETEVGEAKACTITEALPAKPAPPPRADQFAAEVGLDAKATGLIDHEVFESINHRGKLLMLASWRDASAATAWKPALTAAAGAIRHRQVRVIRDYSMFDRREAPQFYPPAARARP